MADLSTIATSFVQNWQTTLLPALTLALGFIAGKSSRSVTIATTLEKDWLNGVADNLARRV